jgi:hypothetical protein
MSLCDQVPYKFMDGLSNSILYQKFIRLDVALTYIGDIIANYM